MKLNLLPSTVNRGAKARTALIVSIIIVLLAAVGAVAASKWSADQKDLAISEARSVEPQAARAVAVANEADAIIAQAAGIIKNTNLAEAMIAHNRVYPDFYDRIVPYIPSFYRITALSATPVDATSVTLNLTGTLKTQQQYADLMLALMRIPGARSITRAGFQDNSQAVPPLNQADQIGEPRRAGEAALPTDPYERLLALEARVQTTGFQNVSNFGAADPLPRGAMPNWSVVNVTVIIQETPQLKANLQVPNPRATMSATGGGATGGGAFPAPGGATGGSPIPTGAGAGAGGGRAPREDE